MFLIWGLGPAVKPLYYLGLKRCEHENKYQHYFVYYHYQQFSLFFVPLLRWSKKYRIACSHCGVGFEITKEQLEKCKTLSNHLFDYKQTLDMMDYLRKQYQMMGHDEYTKKDLYERISFQYDIVGHEKEVDHMIDAIMEENLTHTVV